MAGRRSFAHVTARGPAFISTSTGLGVGGVDGFEQLFLSSGKIEVSTVAALGFDSEVRSEKENRHVGLTREFDGAGYRGGIGRLDKTGTLLVVAPLRRDRVHPQVPATELTLRAGVP